ncbi:hypothetical protein U1Q18_015214 [Sarracenia purpurea var. burkii]
MKLKKRAMKKNKNSLRWPKEQTARAPKFERYDESSAEPQGRRIAGGTSRKMNFLWNLKKDEATVARGKKLR